VKLHPQPRSWSRRYVEARRTGLEWCPCCGGTLHKLGTDGVTRGDAPDPQPPRWRALAGRGEGGALYEITLPERPRTGDFRKHSGQVGSALTLTSWQNATETGSPPCSPQMPSLRPGRALRPRSVAMRTSSPTPPRSIVTNGSTAVPLRQDRCRWRNRPRGPRCRRRGERRQHRGLRSVVRQFDAVSLLTPTRGKIILRSVGSKEAWRWTP
jgi:hypothetical protein